MVEDVRMSGQPFDRLTGLCAEMGEVLDREENQDVKAIIMVHDPEHGGISTIRMEDENETVSVMIIHLKAIFAAHGKTFQILTDSHFFDVGKLP